MAGEFQAAGAQLIASAMAGMYLTAHEMMMASLEECPEDTGVLKNSARISEVVKEGAMLTVTIGYGYGDEPNPKTGHIAADYAVPVHEIIEARHAPPTKAKFLEDPVIERSDTLGPNMAIFMTRGRFEGGRVVSWQEQIGNVDSSTGSDLLP